MSCTVFLFRHGHHSQLHRLVGRSTGVHLSEQGRREAEALGVYLAERGLSAVYSGPLERVRETAEIVASACGLGVEIDPAFDEVDFGEWRGKAFEDLAGDVRWELWNRKRSTQRAPGGETIAEVRARVVGGLCRVAKLHDRENVGVACHGDVIKAALFHFLEKREDNWFDISVDTGAVCELRIQGQHADVVGINFVPEISEMPS